MRCPSRKVLLLTNAEHGQANVFLATGHALVQLGADVHFASFPAIEESVKKLLGSTVTFHPLKGVDMKTAYPRAEVLQSGLEGKSPTFFSMPTVFRLCLHTILPWSGPEYVEIYRSVIETLQAVKPDIIAIDPAFAPAITACRHMGERFLILAPNAIKDFAMPFQPAADVFCKYPCVASGLPYPLPWYLVIVNIYYVIVAILVCRYDKKHKAVKAYVKAHTGGTMVTLDDLNQHPPPGVKYLVANLPELEFPLATVPPHIMPCGPIIRPAPSVAEVDRDLFAWLCGGPSVYINLGTHTKTTERTAVQIAESIRLLLERAEQHLDDDDDDDSHHHSSSTSPPPPPLSRLRVLWKLTRKPPGYDDTRLRAVLGRHLDADRVRIVSWLAAEPSSLLLGSSNSPSSPPPPHPTPTCVCAVHHGGANSFLEAAAAGVPQVVLPAWIDCFDYAHRAELLGVGAWGNRRARPRAAAAELAPVLVETVFGRGAARRRARARELARLCAGREAGRVVAARAILGEI